MSSALKPALPPATGQASPGNSSTAAGKVMSGAQGMTQHGGSPASYPSGPLAHVPQNLAGLPHAHGNMGMPPTNSTNMAANMSVSAMPNISQLSSHPGIINQVTPLNVPGTHLGPTKINPVIPSNVASSAGVVVHGRPTAHPYLSTVGVNPPTAIHPPRDEEGTTLPPSQNSAQLMAMHRAQQQNHQQQIPLQPLLQPHHEQQTQNITDRFKQQQLQQQPLQSNGTVSGPTEPTYNKTTVPTPPASTDTSPTVAPPVQNHVPVSSAVVHEQNNVKQPVEVTSPLTTVSPAPTQAVVSSEPKAIIAVAAAVAATVTTTTSTPAIVEPTAELSQPATITPIKAAVIVTVVPPKETVKAPSTLKLATTPRTTTRKRETKVTKNSESPKSNASSPVKTPDGRSPGAQNNKPPDKTPKNARSVSNDDRKSKRTRTRTQPYQSPIPELALITKLSTAGSSSPSKAHDEKLIVFYKNEFLAVRNAEGGFYVCQVVQNVYKSSTRIRIRWLSQDKQDKSYIPDFYDFTEFDCILTNLNMERVEKGKFNLPKDELERTENILKRALAVESGGSAPSLTEEHPDGLDLSLFRDESQLKKKRKSAKRKSSEPLSTSSGNMISSRTRNTPDKVKVRKLSKSPATRTPIKRNNQTQPERKVLTNVTTSGGNNERKEGRTSSRRSDSGRAERAKRRGESTVSSPIKTSPVVDSKKARMLAKVALKTAIPASSTQNKKKTGRPAPSTKATGNVTASKVGTKASTRSQMPAASTAATVSSVSSTRRGKKTKK